MLSEKQTAYTTEYEKLNCWKGSMSFQSCDMSDLKVGDKVYCEFVPFSQQYVYDAIPTYGTVVSVSDDVLLSREGNLFPMLIDGFHVFAMSMSYAVCIFRAL